MSIDPVNSSSYVKPPAAGPSRAGRPPAEASFAAALDGATVHPTAEEPPAEALSAVQVAGRVYDELRASDRQLHFEHTSHGVRIDVYDGDGQLVQRVPATDVLKLAEGEKTWLA